MDPDMALRVDPERVLQCPMPCLDRTSPKLAFNDATDPQRKSRQSFSAFDLSCCDAWCTFRSFFHLLVLFQLSNFRMSTFVRHLRCPCVVNARFGA